MDLIQLLRQQGKQTRRNRRLRPTTPSKRTEVWYRHQLVEFIRSMRGTIEAAARRVALGDRDPDDLPSASVMSIAFNKAIEAAIQQLADFQVGRMVDRLTLGMI